MTQENSTPNSGKPAAINPLRIKNGRSYFQFKKGVEVIINPVSPALLVEVQRLHEIPKIPIVRVAVGDGTFMEEENPEDPSYKRAVAKYNEMVEDDWGDMLLQLGVELTGPVNQKEVDRVKSFMLNRFKIDLASRGDGTDEYIYVRYVLPSSEEELANLVKALMGRSQPDEGSIAQAMENFSGNIQR